jgi:hypothetical protein
MHGSVIDTRQDRRYDEGMSDNVIPLDHRTTRTHRLIDATTGADLGPATPDQVFAVAYSSCIMIDGAGNVIEPGAKGAKTARVVFVR